MQEHLREANRKILEKKTERDKSKKSPEERETVASELPAVETGKSETEAVAAPLDKTEVASSVLGAVNEYRRKHRYSDLTMNDD